MLRKVLDRESCVKSNLIKRLIDCVKELQFKNAADKGAALVNDEATNLLCWILEAVFIHGLKNPFFKSMSSVFQNRLQSVPPEPSFWEFVLIFCHQDVILQINRLSFISTDVGRCRAWLRLALNDGLFISYLQMMLKDKSTLREYYKPAAFLRDPEKCDMLKSYLYGIESYDFQLASNSSLLNTWNSGPLSLVGLWTATSPSDWVTQGVDVAENMDSRDLQVLPSLQSSSSGRSSPSCVPIRPPLLEEEEALRYILASKPSGSKQSSRRSSHSTPPKETYFAKQDQEETRPSIAQKPSSEETLTRPKMESAAKQSPAATAVSVIQRKIEESASSRTEKVEVGTTAEDSSGGQAVKIVTTLVGDHGSPSSNAGQEEAEVTGGNGKKGEKEAVESLGSYTDLLNTYNQNIPVGTPITSSYMESIFSGLGLKDEENRSLSVRIFRKKISSSIESHIC